MEKKLKYNENDYIFSATRIRALENMIMGYEKCNRLCETKTVAEMNRLLEENGVKNSESSLESALNGLMSDTFKMICGMIPDPELIDIQRYPYDCHNIKSAMKCMVRHVDCRHLLYEFGSVAVEDIIKMVDDRSFELLPSHMAEAAANALESYEKTLDPQVIDILLDNACWVDMSESAKVSGIEFLQKMVDIKIDLTNILTCIRIIRITAERKNINYLERMLIPAGTLDMEFFRTAYISGEAELKQQLIKTTYKDIFSDIKNELPLNIIEKRCEDYYIRFISTAKNKITGIEILTAYITAREYEAKNIRIIAAGKASGLSADIIRERLRVNYV